MALRQKNVIRLLAAVVLSVFAVAFVYQQAESSPDDLEPNDSLHAATNAFEWAESSFFGAKRSKDYRQAVQEDAALSKRPRRHTKRADAIRDAEARAKSTLENYETARARFLRAQKAARVARGKPNAAEAASTASTTKKDAESARVLAVRPAFKAAELRGARLARRLEDGVNSDPSPWTQYSQLSAEGWRQTVMDQGVSKLPASADTALRELGVLDETVTAQAETSWTMLRWRHERARAPTQRFVEAVYSPSKGVIVDTDRPKAAATPAQDHALDRWSDVTYLTWALLCRAQKTDAASITIFMFASINDLETLLVISGVSASFRNGLPKSSETTVYRAGAPIFNALLGSRYGLDVVDFLMRHRAEVGKSRSIKNIRV